MLCLAHNSISFTHRVQISDSIIKLLICIRLIYITQALCVHVYKWNCSMLYALPYQSITVIAVLGEDLHGSVRVKLKLVTTKTSQSNACTMSYNETID